MHRRGGAILDTSKLFKHMLLVFAPIDNNKEAIFFLSLSPPTIYVDILTSVVHLQYGLQNYTLELIFCIPRQRVVPSF